MQKNNDIYEKIYNTFIFKRRVRRAIKFLLWAVFIAAFISSIVSIQRTRNSTDFGTFGSIWLSLVTGTLFTNQNSAILPSSNYPNQSEIVYTIIGIGLMTIFVTIAIISLVVILGIIISFIYHSNLLEHNDNKLFNRLLKIGYWPRLINAPLKNIFTLNDDMRLSVYGKNIVISQKLAIPTFVLEPCKKTTLSKMIKKDIIFPSDFHFVTDGTTLQHNKIYMPPQNHIKMLRFFDDDIRAFAVLHFENIAVFSSSSTVTYLIDGSVIKDPKTIRQIIDNIERFKKLSHRKAIKQLEPGNDMVNFMKVRSTAQFLSLSIPLRIYSLFITIILLLAALFLATLPSQIDLAPILFFFELSMMLFLSRYLTNFIDRII